MVDAAHIHDEDYARVSYRFRTESAPDAPYLAQKLLESRLVTLPNHCGCVGVGVRSHFGSICSQVALASSKGARPVRHHPTQARAPPVRHATMGAIRAKGAQI